jgi:branched-subunit amino acid aminotransferase/4-amino-4-deoxychorismate lyase
VTQELVYINGSLVPRSKACVLVTDHGFLYGYGLFETMRAYNGVIFLLERHIARLRGGAETIRLSGSISGMDLAAACLETLKANRLNDSRMRLTVTNGDAEALPWAGERGRPTVVVTARPYTPLPREKYELGYRAGIVSIRRCCHTPISGVKSTGYLVSVMAKMEAAGRGFDEALLLNDRGFVAEGGTSNVFFIDSAGRLVTPSLEGGILPGITRGLVMELTAGLSIGVEERDISPADLPLFKEAFLTASTMEIMPLVEVAAEGGEQITFGEGKPGKLTLRLMAAYRQRVAQETRRG